MTALKYWNGTGWVLAAGGTPIPDPLTLYNGLTLDTANLTFVGIGNRITGDMTNATHANRLLFQNSVANGNTIIGAIPNGTGTGSQLNLYNSVTPDNSGLGQITMTTTGMNIVSNIIGTGSYVPLIVIVGGAERMRIDLASTFGRTGISGPVDVAINGNAHMGDGGTWARFDTVNPLSHLVVGRGDLTFYNAVAGTGSPAWTSRFRIGVDGNVVFANNLYVTGGSIYLGPPAGTGSIRLSDWNPGELRVYGKILVDGVGSFGGAITSGGRVQGGDLFTAGGYIYLTGDGTASYPHIIGSGGTMYYRANGVHNFQNLAGAAQIINAARVDTPQVYFPNGYYFSYVSGQAALATNGNLQVSGQMLVLDSTYAGQNIRNWGGGYISTSSLWGCVGSGNYGWGYQQPDSHANINYTKAINTGWHTHSRRELKADIRPLKDPLSVVLNPDLHGVAYDHIHRSGDNPVLEPSIGFVAEDWYPHVPEVVGVNAEGKVMAMDYGRVGAITFEAMKQLATQVKELEARLAALETPA